MKLFLHSDNLCPECRKRFSGRHVYPLYLNSYEPTACRDVQSLPIVDEPIANGEILNDNDIPMGAEIEVSTNNIVVDEPIDRNILTDEVNVEVPTLNENIVDEPINRADDAENANEPGARGIDCAILEDGNGGGASTANVDDDDMVAENQIQSDLQLAIDLNLAFQIADAPYEPELRARSNRNRRTLERMNYSLLICSVCKKRFQLNDFPLLDDGELRVCCVCSLSCLAEI